MMEKCGQIKDLRYQVPYLLQEAFRDHNGNWNRAITYVADFAYMERGKERITVEDCKGMKTEVYRIKKKLFLHKYPDLNFIET